MKKIIILLVMALILGFAPARADKHHGNGKGHGPRVEHRERRPEPPRHHKPKPPKPPKHHHTPPPPPRAHHYYTRPVGINVSFGPLQLVMSNAGLYYREVGPGRYAVERPPMGMVVPRIPRGRRVYHRGHYCHLVQGVLYLPLGNGFKVVGYVKDKI